MDRMAIYRQYAPAMKSCDLVEFRGGLLGAGIRLVTGTERNHSAILLRFREFEGCKDRRYIIEAKEHGLRLTILSEFLERYEGEAWWSPLRASDDARDRMISWALDELGRDKPYDYGSLFRQLVARVSVDAKAWFCSESYQAMLTAGGLLAAGGRALRPGEFAKLGLHEDPVQILFKAQAAPAVAPARAVNGN